MGKIIGDVISAYNLGAKSSTRIYQKHSVTAGAEAITSASQRQYQAFNVGAEWPNCRHAWHLLQPALLNTVHGFF